MGELAEEVWDDERCEAWDRDFHARAIEAVRNGTWIEFSQENIASTIPEPVQRYLERRERARREELERHQGIGSATLYLIK